MGIVLAALLAYLLSLAIDFEGTLRVWLERPDREWIGALVPAMLAAAVTWGTVLFHRRRILAREYIARANAEHALRVRAEQLESLRRIGLELTAQRDFDALLRFIIARAVDLVQGDAGGLYLYRPEADVLEWTMAVGPHPSPVGTVLHCGEGLAGRIWQTGKPLAVDDYRCWPGRTARDHGVTMVAAVGVPVTWGAAFLGVLSVVSRRPGAFGAHEIELLSMFVMQAAVAIEGVRLLEQTQRQSERLARLLKVSQSLHRGLDLDQVLNHVASGAVHVGFRRAVINVEEPEERKLVARAIAGIEGAERDVLLNATYSWADLAVLMQERFRVSGSYMIRHGEVDWERDFAGPVVVPESAERGPGFWKPEDALLVPLTGTRGRPVGILSVDEPVDGRIPDLATIQTLEALANHAGVAIENARLYESARRELQERERLEQQLVQAQKMEAVGQLAGGVAHDFNNLLTIINGYSDFILRNGELSPQLRSDVDEIRRAGERAADLTRQLLAFGRRQMQELRVFDLNEVLIEMAKMLRRLIGENITLALELADEALPILPIVATSSRSWSTSR
ncbi:MAG TPA: GAF domain-containing protein [Chloroflexi bacterium]|nr:GAF domain-containing protein [Chloroflexota bacterium]